jgi:hypothetical protein
MYQLSTYELYFKSETSVYLPSTYQVYLKSETSALYLQAAFQK